MQIIELPAHCDRSAAIALVPDFVEAMGDVPIKVDASKVERLGLAACQLLVSAGQNTGGLNLVNPSSHLVDALRLAGLESLLADGDRA